MYTHPLDYFLRSQTYLIITCIFELNIFLRFFNIKKCKYNTVVCFFLKTGAVKVLYVLQQSGCCLVLRCTWFH